ncbi:MAG: hypothetical protein P4K83_07060 [Terracidiphilus sp.]|nr:hypothetical protein [Terracidiphilus sp.]
MNVSPVNGLAAMQSAAPGSTNAQSLQDWKGLGNSLANGDLKAAQNYFDDFQKLNSKLFSSSASQTQLGKDLASLASALNSQDLKSAQDAFASVKKDLSPGAVQIALDGISNDRNTSKLISMIQTASSTTSQSSDAAQSTVNSDTSAGDESTSSVSVYA